VPTAESPARHSGFRPDIEGLRAVAILTVLAHHAGLPLHGGFIGVDIFFVISGFLITGLLVTELWTTGTISWSRFVGRRIRRLLPAAVLVLVLTSLVSYLVVPGLRRRDIGVDIAASAAYVVNWVFARREVDYLAADIRPSPVQHFWSLAVEEQFYVLWPLLLIVLALVVRRPSRRVVLGALGALVAVSFVWSIWFSDTSPRPAFFTTTTRVWELGVGAMLAVTLAGRPRPASPVRGARVLGWAALLTLVAVAALLPDGIDWPGAWALLPTVPTAVLLWLGWQSGGGHGAGRVLGLAPMVWIGGLSYSIYLWALAVHRARGMDRGCRGHHSPGLGKGRARRRVDRPGLAVVALRRDAHPPRSVAARAPAGPARERAGTVAGGRARCPAAAAAALTVHHDATGRSGRRG
jgi:peptidoglycan/LPS O-acetylase OafA/YrhL